MTNLRRTLHFLRPLPVLFFVALTLHGPARAASLAATYKHGMLSLTIPYHAERAGAGELTVEILDPEDQVLGSAVRTFNVAQGDGSLQQFIAPKDTIPLDEFVWERVRFRFVFRGETTPAFEQTSSISQILRRPSVHIFGQKS